MGIKTKQLRELTNPEAPVSQQIKEKIYPITHEKAVIDDNGNTLDNKLVTIIEEAADAASKTITPLKNDCIQIKNDTQTLKEDTQNIKTAAETSLDTKISNAQTTLDNKIAAADSVYDVSADHSGTPYSTLSEALAAIPDNILHEGMSIKFIQGTVGGSDNTYVQYRYMGTAATGSPNPFLYPANWQGVDELPIPNSKNIVSSGGTRQYVDEQTYTPTELTPTEYKSNLPKNNGGTVSGGAINCRSYVYSIDKTSGKLLVKTKFNGTSDTNYEQVSYCALYDSNNTQLYASEVITNPKPAVLECDLMQYPTAASLKVTAPTPSGSTTYATVTFYEEKYLRKEKETGFVKVTDVINSLDSDETAKPLSAKQGKVLAQGLSSSMEEIDEAANDITDIQNVLEDVIITGYKYRENGDIDSNYTGATAVFGRGNVIAANATIYKIVINCGNYNTASPITKIKMQLYKVNWGGDVLATKVVDYAFTDNNYHDVEFDFSDSPITYSGNIYCTVQFDNPFTISIISATDYVYGTSCVYTTSSDLENPASWSTASGAAKAIYANIAYEKVHNVDVTTDDIENEAVTEEKLSQEVQEKINTPSSNKGVKAQLPSEIVVVAGSRLQLFYRGIVTAFNPYNYNIEVTAINRATNKTSGVALPRYYQLDVQDYCNIHKYTEQPLPTGDNIIELSYPLTNADGNYFVKDVVTSNASETARIQGLLEPMANGSRPVLYIQDGMSYTIWNVERRKINVNATFDLTINVRDNNNDIIDTASSVIRTFSLPSSPATQMNILVFGASVIAKGYVADELRRRLTLATGTINAPTNPLGISLSNLSFIGRKTGSTVQDIHQEATGGWSWSSYVGTGEPRYRFYVTDGSGNNVGANETFVIAELTFTVKEKNIDGNTGNGNFSCTYTGTQSGDVPATGTIAFQSGNVNYSNISAETSGNPFWNPNKTGGAGIDFKFYADTYCNGATIDLLVSHCGVNDIAGATWNKNNTINAIKAIARAYKQYCTDNSIDGKFIISSIAVPDPTGGFGINYYADGAVSNYYTALRKLFELAQIFEDIANDDEFSSFVVHAPVMPESDGENMYPQTDTNVNNRNTKNEPIGQNAYHPEELGHKIVADSIYQSICDVLQQ